jgi:hypothetical protein
MRPAVLLLTAGCTMSTLFNSVEAQPSMAWDPPVEIASGGGYRGAWRMNESLYDYVDDPSVALDARGAAAVAWVDQRRKDVLFQVFEPDGTPRYKQPVDVSRSPRIFSWLPRLVLSPMHAGDVFVLWQEIVFSGGSHGGDIFFARSHDGGASFAEPVNLSRSRAGDGKGRISKDVWHNGSLDLTIGPDGTLYVAWTEYEGTLWFSRSNDRGHHFTQPMRVSGSRDQPARGPALAAGRDNSVYLAWTIGEDNSADVRIAGSTDGGAAFGESFLLARTPGHSDAPKVAVDRHGTVHVVHAESAGDPFDRSHVRYTRSRDGAKTFEPPRDISRQHPQGIESAAFPALALDDQDGVHVVWEIYHDYRADPRGLAFTYSRDGGRTFSPPAIVPGSIDPSGGSNGSHQGLLMRKLAVNGAGAIAVVNSALKQGETSRVWLMRGQLRAR